MIRQTRVLDIHRSKNPNLRQTGVSSGGGGWELQTLIACGCPVPCAYVYVLCEHGTPMYMHMSVCTHMSNQPSAAWHCMRTRICSSLTCASITCIAHMRIDQYRSTIYVSQSVIFGSNTRSGATPSRPNGLPEKPPLTAYVYTRTKSGL